MWIAIGWTLAGVFAVLFARQARRSVHLDEALTSLIRTVMEQAETEPEHRGVYVVPPNFIGDDEHDVDLRA